MSLASKHASILDFFPKGLIPRTSQVEALNALESNYDQYDVFVLEAPVAVGKSNIAVTAARWAANVKKNKSRILTPMNVLVEQYLRDFPVLHTLPAAHSFTCVNSVKKDIETGEEYSHSCSKEKQRGEKVYCSNCPYVKRKKQGYVMPYGVYNTYTYLANQYYRPLVLIDEAHGLLGTLREMNAKKYWQQDYGFPSTIRTYQQLHDWLKKVIPSFSGAKQVRLQLLLKELEGNRTRFVVQKTTDLLRGVEEEVIKLLPVDVREYGGLLWPSKKVQKLILMSATINRMDIENLGLDSKRVLFIKVKSAIPKDRRPLVVDKTGINLAFKQQEVSLPKLVSYIRARLADHPNEKGLIHVTYAMMGRLKALLADEDRLIWHTREDKMLKYKEFLNSSGPKVMVAAGLYEGIDLPEDLGRWQIITKMPFPSLESPAIQYLAETNPEWYNNECIRVVVQAYGRICRGPEDYGKTYIVDSCFERLYKESGDLFPSWFRECIDA